ncbi:ATP-binding protein [Streptomyces tendae]
MRFGILGPLDIRTDDGTPVDPGGPRPRALLTLLLLDAGRTVPATRLIDGLYGSEPPAGAANALQSQISRLRGRLAPHTAVEAGGAGYRLVAPPESVDAHTFERLCGNGRAALAAGDHARAATALREALALWRGPALPDLPEVPAEAARLTELRLTAVQDRIEADLALGGGPELVPELRALLSAHPLSERLYGQLMRALHAAGLPAEALTVYEEARRTLAEQLGADPSPELSALHGELLRGHTAAAPRRPRLPAQLTRCVGRDAELDRIASLFAEARLVTLTGPGGTGKTRLAIEAASRCGTADSLADVCFVELAPLTDGGQIPYAVLTALGVREGFRTTGVDATERLLTALEDREALLVLDNCEHLVDAAATLTALLLGACRGVRILATSRESLQITGEALVPVPPLSPRPSVELFLERARAVRPGFDGHARVPEICAALDGLPLAVELAAARLRTLAPDELADRLDDRFRLLSRGDRAKAPRHRTLRAVVEWSWELLDDEERELARRFTVFTGGATLEAVEAVCGVPHPEDLLASLVEKSLLEHLPEGRYRMLETLRAFAAESLTGRKALRDAHAAYFLDLAERAEPHLRTGGQRPWLARLAAELGNLDAAQRHLTRTDPREALRLMAELTWFHWLRGLHGEQVPRARALLAAVGDEPPEGLAEEYALCAMNAISSDGGGDGGGDGDGAGKETGNGDDAPAGTGRVARVSALMESLDRPLRLPFAVVLHSLTCGPMLVADAVPRVQVGKGPWGLALLDMGIGYQELFAGRAAEAEAAFTRSLDGFRATGDRWGMANCLDPLGGFANRRGAYDRALELLDEGLVHVRELEAPEETADLLRSRALVLLHRGEAEEAAGHFTHSAALARSVGAGDKVASARRGLGDVARLSGDTARARVEYENALRLCADNWFSTGESVRILVGLGRTAAAEGDARTAADWLEQARVLALDSPDVLALAEVAESLAVVTPAPERAAELLGAATGLRGAPAPGDPDAARAEREVRARLAPEAYDRAFARGRRLRAAAVSAR